MHPPVSRVALKEWAVTTKALGQGDQILILQDNTTLEQETIRFPEFFLYPTFENKNDKHVKEEFQNHLRQAIEEDDTPGMVVLSHWAEATDAFDIEKIEDMKALSPFHIWTEEYISDLIANSARNQATVMLVRVFELTQPQALPILDEYAQSGPWVELVEDVPLGEVKPVLTDEEYENKAKAVRDALSFIGAKTRR